MESNARMPINWWFISVLTVVWIGLSVMTLGDVWTGLWRSFPTAAGEITDQALGRRQMMYGWVAFFALLFAYVFAPKRNLPPSESVDRYLWAGRVALAAIFAGIALAQVMASGATA